jgi:hypothetical protein
MLSLNLNPKEPAKSNVTPGPGPGLMRVAAASLLMVAASELGGASDDDQRNTATVYVTSWRSKFSVATWI